MLQNQARLLLGMGLLLLASVGCNNTGRPRWFHPGSLERQRERAEQFDPYPEQDIGPESLGTRPPGFEHNVAEPRRARWWESKAQ